MCVDEPGDIRKHGAAKTVELKGTPFATQDDMNTAITTEGRVVQIIRSLRAAPFLEVSSISEVAEDELRRIVDDLQQRGLIAITPHRDESSEVIVATEKLLTSG